MLLLQVDVSPAVCGLVAHNYRFLAADIRGVWVCRRPGYRWIRRVRNLDLDIVHLNLPAIRIL